MYKNPVYLGFYNITPEKILGLNLLNVNEENDTVMYRPTVDVAELLCVCVCACSVIHILCVYLRILCVHKLKKCL